MSHMDIDDDSKAAGRGKMHVVVEHACTAWGVA